MWRCNECVGGLVWDDWRDGLLNESIIISSLHNKLYITPNISHHSFWPAGRGMKVLQRKFWIAGVSTGHLRYTFDDEPPHLKWHINDAWLLLDFFCLFVFSVILSCFCCQVASLTRFFDGTNDLEQQIKKRGLHLVLHRKTTGNYA